MRDYEREDLRRVGGGKNARRHAELHRIEVLWAEERTAAAVCLVRGGRVRVVVVLDEPVRRGDVRDEVAAREDVTPKTLRVGGAWKQGADADDSDRNLRVSDSCFV